MKEKKLHKVMIKKEYCKRCGICINICPTKVFEEDERGYPAVKNIEKCTGCKLCETHCPDFAVWVDNEEHPLWKYLRIEKIPHVWCPGCGIGIVLQSILRAIDKIGLDKNKIVMVSGIGCSGRMPGYVDFNTLHTTHGRALAFATGIKLAKPDLKVIVVLGDGDGVAIGGNHLIHTARRNVPLTVILINNYIYGMTGGQVSPTTPHLSYATTSPYGNVEYPFDVAQLVASAGGNFVARTTTYHTAIMDRFIEKALKKDGFNFVEVVSQCPTYYGRLNKKPDPFEMLSFYKKGLPLKLGVLKDEDNKTLIDLMEEVLWKSA